MNIGQRVICVDDSIKQEAFLGTVSNFQQWIKKGVIYTIRDVLHNDDIVTGILLKEVRNKPVYIKLINREQEPAFATWRFRELEEEYLEETLEEELVLSTLLQIAKEIEKL